MKKYVNKIFKKDYIKKNIAVYNVNINNKEIK